MVKPLTSADLPEDVAGLAASRLAAGQFETIEEFLSACAGAMAQRDAASRYPLVGDEAAFLAAVREGMADAARGDLTPHDEVVAATEDLIATIASRRQR